MSRTITFFFVITAVARMGIALSIVCEVIEEPPRETVNSWLCDILEWMESMKEWKDRVERDCSSSVEDLGTEWTDLFSCGDPVEVSCTNQDLHRCENDDWFNCTICFCWDGRYEGRQNYNLFWRRQQLTFRKALTVYNERLRYCGERTECTESTVSSTEVTKQTFTTAPRSVTETPTTTEDTMTSATTQMDTPTVIGGTEANYESTTMAGRNCSNFLDVMFVVDGSGSVGAENFEVMKEWLINQTLKINSAYGSCARQQVLEYSDKDSAFSGTPIAESNRFVIPFTLNDDFSNCEDCLRERIANMTYFGGHTYTYYALRRAMEVEFPNSERYNVSKKFVIVLTDGQATDRIFLNSWYQSYKDQVTPFAIGVGNDASFVTDLQNIANGGESFERVIVFDDFEYLSTYTLLLDSW